MDHQYYSEWVFHLVSLHWLDFLYYPFIVNGYFFKKD
jgi:hypothetical protein